MKQVMPHQAFIDRVLTGQDRYGIPLLALLALGQGAQGVAGALESASGRKQAEKMSAAQIAADKARSDQSTGLQESLANPFRHQAAQASTASALDRLERGTYSRPSVSLPNNPYAKYVPQVSGGFSYEKSPELINSARNLKTDVMAGRTAPTMTDPLNYGRTATLSLDANGNPAPGTTNGVQAFRPPVDKFLTSSYTPTDSGARDYTIADARSAVSKAITTYQGRAATPQEVDQILGSQGWKPGDRWVGQGGLLSVLQVIANGPASHG